MLHCPHRHLISRRKLYLLLHLGGRGAIWKEPALPHTPAPASNPLPLPGEHASVLTPGPAPHPAGILLLLLQEGPCSQTCLRSFPSPLACPSPNRNPLSTHAHSVLHLSQCSWSPCVRTASALAPLVLQGQQETAGVTLTYPQEARTGEPGDTQIRPGLSPGTRVPHQSDSSSLLGHASVSLGCHNRSPKPGLRTTEMDSLIVLETRSLGPKGQGLHSP